MLTVRYALKLLPLLPSHARLILSASNMRLRSSIAIASLAATHACNALAVGGRPGALIRDDNGKRAPLQDIVTFDERSLFINGERVMIFSGEIHPYRLPVPSLWADVLHKIKALGLNTISIYIDWAQLEGKPGDFSAEGIFDYARFFEIAKEVGLYVIARPGPYISEYRPIIYREQQVTSSRRRGLRRRIPRMASADQGFSEDRR